MSRFKLILKDYFAIIIDMVLSATLSLLPFIAMKVLLKEMYQKYFPPSDIAFYSQLNFQILIGLVFIITFIIFKVFRSLKKGSPGERILKLD